MYPYYNRMCHGWAGEAGAEVQNSSSHSERWAVGKVEMWSSGHICRWLYCGQSDEAQDLHCGHKWQRSEEENPESTRCADYECGKGKIRNRAAARCTGKVEELMQILSLLSFVCDISRSCAGSRMHLSPRTNPKPGEIPSCSDQREICSTDWVEKFIKRHVFCNSKCLPLDC